MRVSLFAIAAALFSFAQSAPAQADDVVFTVPVRIENAPSVQTGSVSCQALFSRDGRTGGGNGRTPNFIVVDGRYVGSASITVTLPAEARRQDLTWWQCDLSLSYAGGSINPSLSEETARQRYTATTGQAVASSRVYARGDFPH